MSPSDLFPFGGVSYGLHDVFAGFMHIRAGRGRRVAVTVSQNVSAQQTQ
jgi:hypothetical protein